MSQLPPSAPTSPAAGSAHAEHLVPSESRRPSRRQSPDRTPSTTTAARVLAMPEIAEMVIGQLNLDSFRLRHLGRAALVCRLWQSISQPMLFRAIDLDFRGLSHPEAESGVARRRPLQGRWLRQSQLYRLLCDDAAKCRLLRHLTVRTFGIFDVKPLLSGRNTLTALKLCMDGPRYCSHVWVPDSSLLEGVGRTLKTLSLTLWCTMRAAEWKELFEPLECVEHLTLDAVVDFEHLQSAPLKLHKTVRALALRAFYAEGRISGNGLSGFLGAFAKLEHLDFSVNLQEGYFPVEALPSSLLTFKLADSDPSGYLDILRRLASPEWLSHLTGTPILSVREKMYQVVHDRRADLGDEAWPRYNALERLVEAAAAGLDKRTNWKESDSNARFWPELLELFKVFAEENAGGEDEETRTRYRERRRK